MELEGIVQEFRQHIQVREGQQVETEQLKPRISEAIYRQVVELKGFLQDSRQRIQVRP